MFCWAQEEEGEEEQAPQPTFKLEGGSAAAPPAAAQQGTGDLHHGPWVCHADVYTSYAHNLVPLNDVRSTVCVTR